MLMDDPNTLAPGAEDAELLRLAMGGDSAAARCLVEQHLSRNLNLARRMLHDSDEAEDVVQDTFVRLWQHGHRWDPARAKLSTWLYQVTLNLCRDRLRRRRRHDHDAVEWLADEAPGPGESRMLDERASALRQAIAQLPDRQREALLLCHFEGLGNIEAAECMQVSVRAMESLLGRARRTLRQILQPAQDDGS